VDAVLFYILREGRASASLADRWATLAEEMALETGDPSLLETLIYTRPERFENAGPLLTAARRARRGHAPLDRALKRLGQPIPLRPESMDQ